MQKSVQDHEDPAEDLPRLDLMHRDDVRLDNLINQRVKVLEASDASEYFSRRALVNCHQGLVLHCQRVQMNHLHRILV